MSAAIRAENSELKLRVQELEAENAELLECIPQLQREVQLAREFFNFACLELGLESEDQSYRSVLDIIGNVQAHAVRGAIDWLIAKHPAHVDPVATLLSLHADQLANHTKAGAA